MNRLEMPAVLAGLDVQRDDGVAVELRPLAVAAVVRAERRCQRHVDQPALRVDREVERPRIRAQSIPPAVAFPRVVTDIARLRDRVELPQLRASARVVRSWIADAARR